MTTSIYESRAAQIEREIEDLVSDYVDSPSKAEADKLFYLMRERTELMHKSDCVSSRNAIRHYRYRASNGVSRHVRIMPRYVFSD